LDFELAHDLGFPPKGKDGTKKQQITTEAQRVAQGT
jgi:hypothetical protein